MKIDFFEAKCRENTINNKLFGICDDENGKKAYTNLNNSKKWIAEVNNAKNKDVVFTSIDNCIKILKKETKDEESTCDGMLTFERSLYLVELKNKRHKGWFDKAKGQLLNTIAILEDNINLSDFKSKKAYVCNKKRPIFNFSKKEDMKQFRDKTNFRLNIETKIIIILSLCCLFNSESYFKNFHLLTFNFHLL